MSEKIIIATDSACDLSKELIKEHDIRVIPLHVNFEDTEYLDGVDIDLTKMFAKVETTGKLPKTSAVAPGEFVQFFKNILKDEPDAHIIYVGIGSTLSTTYQSACLAKEIMNNDRIHILDSMNLSTGIGLILLKASIYRSLGWSVEKVVRKLKLLIPRVKVQFVIKTLDYLRKGGRCKTITFIIGSLLKIRPMIAVREGKLVVGRKVIGPMRKACLDMMKIFDRDIDKIDPEFVFITHCCGEESIGVVKAEVEKYDKVENLYITQAGCTIGTHCGPGCIGILYILKDENVELEFDEED